MEEVPVHLDDLVVELTEADENWLTVNAAQGLTVDRQTRSNWTRAGQARRPG
jgi:hypothetical protein